MSWRRVWTKARFLLSGRQDDLAEEIRAHLALEEAEQRADGRSEEAARDAARRRFGNVTLAAETSRETWTWPRLETVATDVRFGLRQLRKNPGFAVVAMLTLALGIGANTAIFSVVNAVLLKPLPFAAPERLVEGLETEEAPGTYPVNPADYLDWRAQNRTLEAMTIFSWTNDASMAGRGEPTSAAVTRVQANFFQTLGVPVALGRTFLAGEDTAGRNRVALLSYGFWQEHFGGDAGIVGKTLQLDAEKYVIAGVMPQAFHFPGRTQVWTPLDMHDQQFQQRGNHGLNVIGRMKPGVTLAQARQDLLAISLRLEKQFPDGNTKVHAVLVPLKERIVGGAQERLLLLSGAVALVLLIACVNVANLLIARASVRQREIALRTSLGAGRLRLVRQLITESLVLAGAAAVLGSAGAWWLLRGLGTATSAFVPQLNPIGMDGRVLLFTVAVSVMAALLFGLVPALQISRARVNESLKAAAQAVVSPGSARSRLRDGLILAEMAITLALLVGAGLLLKSFVKLQRAGLGVDPKNVLTTTINLPETNYPDYAARKHFFDGLLQRAGRMPGVEAAALSREIPLEGGNNGYIHVDGASDPSLASVLIGFNAVTPDYFKVYGIRLLRGRVLDAADGEQDGVVVQKLKTLFLAAGNKTPKIPDDFRLHVVISRTAARTFWKGRDALGATFHWSGTRVEVVGIVDDVKEYGIRAETMAQAYFPQTFDLPFSGTANLTVKTVGAPSSVLPQIRRAVQGMDSGLAVLRPRTMEQLIRDDTQDARVETLLLGSFALLALVLAAVGLYGVMSYTVAQRTREIGIRMAIGARRGDVLRMIFLQALRLTLAGIGMGLLLAVGLSRSIEGLLFGVSPWDPATFGLVAGLLAVVAFAAYAIPARRATQVDPILALRYE